MNDQCHNCKIRKWCDREEPEEDGSCDNFVEESEYVRFMDC